jgi:lipoprotein-anchoring transpeptidase ErfK/SrfK
VGKLKASRRPVRATIVTAVLLCLGITASACQDSPQATSPQSGRSGPDQVVIHARLKIMPRNGAGRVKPSTPITVHAVNATLTAVIVRSEGELLGDQPPASGSEWQSRTLLHTSSRYTVEATALDAAGKTVTATSSFRTLTPKNTVRATIFQGLHRTYGVGMPIMITFSSPVVNKRAVERAIELRSSTPVVGSWYWDGDSTLDFRPRSYWPANTTVHFVADLDGVETAPGIYAVHTLTQTFRIGRSLIAVANTTRHRVRIYLNHKLFGDWPMSSGKPGDDTPNGTYLSIEKHNPEEMKGPGYDISVPWSVRFTWSGDYLHDAFWSVGQQGFENVSHGCINLSPANAETYYKLSVPGDPVTVTGSPRGGRWGNGWTVWFLGWKELLAGSALHRAVRVGPDGSTFVKPANLHGHTKPAPLGAPAPGNSDPA